MEVRYGYKETRAKYSGVDSFSDYSIPAPSFDLLDEKYTEDDDVTLEKSLKKDRCRPLEEIECNLARILDTPPRQLHKLYTSEVCFK